MTGKRQIFSKLYLLVFIIVLVVFPTKAQSNLLLESKAVSYFCEKINQINSKLIDYDIRFKGYTTGYPSRVYNIADCFEEISLIKNSIPNESKLDSLKAMHNNYEKNVISLQSKCTFLKKNIFAPFNKRIYTLEVYNTIEYKDMFYVELYLSNKNLNTWIVCVEFNQEGEPIRSCASSMIY
jgi:hypothetical protein